MSLLILALGCALNDKTAEDSAVTESVVVLPDADGDGIIDVHEGDEDIDGDSLENAWDDDSDGDGLLDSLEDGDNDPETYPVDSDGDGVPDFRDDDSDNNCIDDGAEAINSSNPVDSDNDDIWDHLDTDNDGDNILDTVELDGCNATDADGDGAADYMDIDADGDGVGDIYEGGTSSFNPEPQDTDADGTPDYLDDDSDQDGTSDRDESGTDGNASTAPRDTDNDGRYDCADTDSDGDSLSEPEEAAAGTDPYDSDTDGDGYSDGGETTAGTDPLDPTSVIEGIYVEVAERTTVEEQFDFTLAIEMGDIVFLIDTTGSMGGTITAISNEFSTMVSELATVLPDAAYGVAGFDDYVFGSYGGMGDKPYYLAYQMTTDYSAVQSFLSTGGLATHGGGDGPESSFEGLYQSATGAGYDQGCNGTYDASTDVLPFVADASDPFGGSGGESYDASIPGSGTAGGLGFRDYALPIIVHATDNYMRDAESSNGMYNGAPGGCPIDAGLSDTVTAFTDNGIRYVGVAVNGSLPYPQMIEFAQQTNSFADLDGDGVAAEEIVQTWSGSNEAFRSTVVNAITQLVQGLKFERVDLSVEGDVYGFVTSIEPTYYEGLSAEDSGTILPFTLTFRGNVAATTEDQLYRLTLNVLGDSTVLLDSLDIIVVVPGTQY